MLFLLMGLGAGNKTYYLWKHKGDYFIIELFCKYIFLIKCLLITLLKSMYLDWRELTDTAGVKLQYYY